MDARGHGRVAQLVRALLSHSRGPRFESVRDHSSLRKRHPRASPRRSPRRRHLCVLVLLRSLVVAASFCSRVLVGAQVPTTRPTPEQAQILLQTRPDLVEQLRQRFATSGLTREQIHARLRAEGYPEDLLDPYLSGMTGSPAGAPTEDVFSAVRALGIADSADVAAMQEFALGDRARSRAVERPVRVRSELLPEPAVPASPGARVMPDTGGRAADATTHAPAAHRRVDRRRAADSRTILLRPSFPDSTRCPASLRFRGRPLRASRQ